MTVYVAVYEHRHGDDVRVFASEAGAEEWRQGLADEWWHELYEYDVAGTPDPAPSDPKEKADFYFNNRGGEYFTVYPREVEG